MPLTTAQTNPNASENIICLNDVAINIKIPLSLSTTGQMSHVLLHSVSSTLFTRVYLVKKKGNAELEIRQDDTQTPQLTEPTKIVMTIDELRHFSDSLVKVVDQLDKNSVFEFLKPFLQHEQTSS